MLSELQVITSLLLPKGCISLSGTYEESGASYVICVTLAQLKLFLPRRPRRSRRCDGHVIPNGRYSVRAERRATDRADGRGDVLRDLAVIFRCANYRRLRMPRKHPQVLGSDLNRSES